MREITVLEFKRRRLGLSQWDLARRSGIVQSRLSLIERVQVYPKEKEAVVIAKHLNVSLRSIFVPVEGQPGKYSPCHIKIQEEGTD